MFFNISKTPAMKNEQQDQKPTQTHPPETPAPDDLKDKGDMGKAGSMQESFQSDEGYFTMDEDEKKPSDKEEK